MLLTQAWLIELPKLMGEKKKEKEKEKITCNITFTRKDIRGRRQQVRYTSDRRMKND